VTAPPKKERHLCGMALRKLRLLLTDYHRLGLIPVRFCFPFGRHQTARFGRKILCKLTKALFLFLGFWVRLFARPYWHFEERWERLGMLGEFFVRFFGWPFWLTAQWRARLQDWLANQEEDGDAN
jgi:hypothetical protein